MQSRGPPQDRSARPVSPAGSQKPALCPVWAQPFALKEPAGWHPWRRLASWTWRGQAWLPQRMGPQLGEGLRPLPVWRSGLPEQKRLGTHPLCALWVHFHWAPWPSAEPSATPEAPRHRESQARLQVVEPAPCSLHGPAPPESLSPPDPICKVRD